MEKKIIMLSLLGGVRIILVLPHWMHLVRVGKR